MKIILDWRFWASFSLVFLTIAGLSGTATNESYIPPVPVYDLTFVDFQSSETFSEGATLTEIIDIERCEDTIKMILVFSDGHTYAFDPRLLGSIKREDTLREGVVIHTLDVSEDVECKPPDIST